MSARLVLTEDEALEAVAFLVTAARTLLDEPADYGPMRLLSAAQQVAANAAPRSAPAAQGLLLRLSGEIPSGLRERLRDPGAYRTFLDGLCRTVAEELARRAGREVQP